MKNIKRENEGEPREKMKEKERWGRGAERKGERGEKWIVIERERGRRTNNDFCAL